MGTNNFTNTTQQVLTNGNLFLLPHLLARKNHGRKPLSSRGRKHRELKREQQTKFI